MGRLAFAVDKKAEAFSERLGALQAFRGKVIGAGVNFSFKPAHVQGDDLSGAAQIKAGLGAPVQNALGALEAGQNACGPKGAVVQGADRTVEAQQKGKAVGSDGGLGFAPGFACGFSHGTPLIRMKHDYSAGRAA